MSGLVCLLFAFSLIPVLTSDVQAKFFKESQVKAVFLFNLTKFISWPEEQLPQGKKTFTIGITGQDPFGYHLKEVVRDETVMDKDIQIIHYKTLEETEWTKLDMLFIGGSKLFVRMPAIRDKAREHKVLTVGDVQGFCDAGGMINLLTVGQRVMLEVNIEETRTNGYIVSAQVLKIARLIGKLPEPGKSKQTSPPDLQ